MRQNRTSRHPFPPVRVVGRRSDIHRLTDTRRHNTIGTPCTLTQKLRIGFLPFVQSKCKFPSMCGKNGTCAHILRRLRRLGRQHVDRVPLHVILPVFHECEIKSVEPLADGAKMLPIAAVSADVNTPLRRNDGKSAPLGVVARQEASGEMLRWQNMDVEIIGERNVRIPILFVQMRKVKSPCLKELADAERTEISLILGFNAMTVA